MSKNIIQQLIDGASIEELCGVFDTIPIQHLEQTIRSADVILKDQLVQQSHIVHMSMQSHHNMGSVNTIKQEFEEIEKHLQSIVYHNLPLHKRFFLSCINFFVEYSPADELDVCIQKIQQSQQEISTYTTVLTLHSKDFLKYLALYDRWVIALSAFVPNLYEQHEKEQEEVSYTLSKLVVHTSEVLMTQKQLEQTITLQLQSNTVLITDILHIIGVSRSLMQNTISAQQFFQQEYVGSMKTIKKYKKKQ